MMIKFLFDWHDQIKKIHNEKKSEEKSSQFKQSIFLYIILQNM